MGNKAVFLDRDNTIIEDPGYINDPGQVKLISGADKALIELKKMGYKLVIVTNQSAVARGIVTEEVLKDIHERLLELLRNKGAYIDAIYYCPYHPEGVVPEYRRESNMRKPNPGMILAAAEDLFIDLDQSWVVGDSYRDIKAGIQAGCKTILIDSPVNPPQKQLGDLTPDKKAVNIKEAVNIIKMFNRATVDSKRIEAQSKVLETSMKTHESKMDEAKPLPSKQLQKQKVKIEEISQTVSPPVITEQIPPIVEGIEPKKPVRPATSNEILEEILKHLKSIDRHSMFEEFSWFKVISGISVVLSVFCFLVSICVWFFDSSKTSVIYILIGYSIILQLTAVAFFLMRDHK